MILKELEAEPILDNILIQHDDRLQRDRLPNPLKNDKPHGLRI
jgi:hypothetical protein